METGPYAAASAVFPAALGLANGAGSLLLIGYGGFSGQSFGDGLVKGGVLRIGPGGPDAGAVYCLGGGAATNTTVQPTDDVPPTFALTGLSRLGTCADAPAARRVPHRPLHQPVTSARGRESERGLLLTLTGPLRTVSYRRTGKRW